jgi:hypothetical protein
LVTDPTTKAKEARAQKLGGLMLLYHQFLEKEMNRKMIEKRLQALEANNKEDY